MLQKLHLKAFPVEINLHRMWSRTNYENLRWMQIHLKVPRLPICAHIVCQTRSHDASWMAQQRANRWHVCWLKAGWHLFKALQKASQWHPCLHRLFRDLDETIKVVSLQVPSRPGHLAMCFWWKNHPPKAENSKLLDSAYKVSELASFHTLKLRS